MENTVVVNRLLGQFKNKITQSKRQAHIKAYLKGGRKPWSRGYSLCKFDFIKDVLNNEVLLEKFGRLEMLDDGYGYGYDERVVEYPWVLSQLSKDKSRLLDAGSALNFQEIIENTKLADKDITIFTLVPENKAFWKKGISYHYGDLRHLPFKDNWFDEIVSISTLEHVGMDNRIYTKKSSTQQVALEAKKAVKELIRTLRAGGKFLASVGFGKRQLIEWNGIPFAEQFDSSLLEDILEEFEQCQSISTSFYKYTRNGWNISTEENCKDAEYFNIHTAHSIDSDNAAAARAVVLIKVIK